MKSEKIDYDGLKRRGFLRQRQDGFFVLRTRMPSEGAYTGNQFRKLAEISEKYARGILHATVRQGLEAPFIKYEDIPKAEAALESAGIAAGTSGPRLRATTACPGTNWCRQGLVDTFSLAGRIEKELGLKCGLDLPHKFKIAISGCPNGCTRPQQSDIGIHGIADTSSGNRRTGYFVHLGGYGGRAQKTGLKIDKIFSEREVLEVVEKTVVFYKKFAKPKQRLGMLIEELGQERSVKLILGQEDELKNSRPVV